jgi:hypothetical protein
MKPILHAESSAKKYGGKAEDYLPIHDFMDSTKSAVADNRHRVITHNAWFIGPDGPLERVFGKTLTNSAGREISVRTIGEQHCLEDFHGVIPTLQDWTMALASEPWMSGMGQPPSSTGLRMSKQTNEVQPQLDVSILEQIVD